MCVSLLQKLRASNWDPQLLQSYAAKEDSTKAQRYRGHVQQLIREASSLDDLRAIQMKYGSTISDAPSLSAGLIAKVPKVSIEALYSFERSRNQS